jgi:RNA-binding protein YlmH
MNTEETILRNRLSELADRAYTQNHYTYTNFLNLNELSIFHQMEQGFSYVGYSLYGQAEGYERQMVCFGDKEQFGYAPHPPVVCAHIHASHPKFAEELSHRDYLGALMNLGIERDMMGDIFVGDKEAYVLVHEQIAPYIQSELTRVRHTVVVVETDETFAPDVIVHLADEEIMASSERLDGIVAKVYHLSRSDSAQTVFDGLVFVNGSLTQNGGKILSAGDIVSVRGYGRFLYDGVAAQSKKGKLRIRIRKYT